MSVGVCWCATISCIGRIWILERVGNLWTRTSIEHWLICPLLWYEPFLCDGLSEDFAGPQKALDKRPELKTFSLKKQNSTCHL